MQQAKMTQCHGDGDWEGKYGRMFSFEVSLQLEDGSIIHGQVNAKSQNPKWKEQSTVWYEVTGEYQGVKKLKLSATDPSQARPRGNDPETTKRIENSWAVQTAIQMVGPLLVDQSEDDYLVVVHRMATRLLKLRDSINTQQPQQ